MGIAVGSGVGSTVGGDVGTVVGHSFGAVVDVLVGWSVGTGVGRCRQTNPRRRSTITHEKRTQRRAIAPYTDRSKLLECPCLEGLQVDGG
jgi:uncharacterized protein YcfJ